MNRALLFVALLFSGCISPGTRISTDHTATALFRAKQGWQEKLAFKQGYALGGADVANRMYWDMYRREGVGAGAWAGDGKGVVSPPNTWSQVAPPIANQPVLRRKLLNVPIPAHTDPDGTEITTQNRTVEIIN